VKSALGIISFMSISFFVGFFAAFLIRHFGCKLGLIDTPNRRSSHDEPIPKGGGVGIFVAFVIAAAWTDVPWTIWVPSIAICAVSLLGDIRDISFRIRLLVHVVCASMISVGRYVLNSNGLEEWTLLVLLLTLSLVFIVGTANCYNFMDGINGLAGMTAIVAFSSLTIYSIIERKGDPFIITGICILSSCMGFLPHNYPRPHVFMGDVGSILLGFLFSSWILWFSRSIREFLLLSLFLFPFYADELNTTIARIRDHEILSRAHRRHIYQLLVNQGKRSHSSVTLAYAILQAIIIAFAMMIRNKTLMLLCYLVLIFTLSFFIGQLIRRKFESTAFIG
jgi:UDP-N-acetylmuramyl pentapeptide phosphotransferase/UDP-N-acetylglucosamine-1-phosphate transferase